MRGDERECNRKERTQKDPEKQKRKDLAAQSNNKIKMRPQQRSTRYRIKTEVLFYMRWKLRSEVLRLESAPSLRNQFTLPKLVSSFFAPHLIAKVIVTENFRFRIVPKNFHQALVLDPLKIFLLS